MNSASQGDTILVQPGTYNENIYISNANNLILMSASGNPDDTIIASNDTSKNVISVTGRAGIVIRGFTINGDASDKAGVYLVGCNGCTIENNKFLDNGMGVSVESSQNTIIRNNTDTVTSGKIGRGVYVLSSGYTNVSGNTISNHNNSIYFDRSPHGTVSGNSVSQSDGSGIVMESSDYSVLESNTVSSNGNKGIYLKSSPISSVKNNVVSSNVGNGIDLELTNETTVRDNIISGNAKDTNIHGILVNTCRDNNLQNNTISNCQYGVAVRYSQDNTFVNNNANDNQRGFYISYSSSRITLSGNKANSNALTGIILERGTNNNIVDRNEVNSNPATGISLEETTSNQISNNNVSINGKGINLLAQANGNTISDNTVNSNGDGVILENASENDLTNNIVNWNSRYGIYLSSSNNSYLVNNTAQNEKRGIFLEKSIEGTISNNIVTDCPDFGLYLTYSSNNVLSKNTAYNNGHGISFDSSPNNEVSGNNVSSNSLGIYMCPASRGNRVYNNCFNNNNNADIKNNKTTWYTEKAPGKNVMSGPTLGGNFWGTPSLLGFSDTHSDSDGDGIIDTPYINEELNITDNYPLIRVVLPVANFNANPTNGFAPLTVQFMDLSQSATSISWDVNGDGKSDSNSSTFTYVYETPGTYAASLTASNKNGTDTKTVQITAEEFKVYPVADFRTSATSGYAPLSVTFTDLSQNATSISWDANSDGIEDSNVSSFVYTYTAAGTYTAKLTATNANGTTTKTATVIVSEEDSGSSGGSSHSSGGGGGGGSPEPATNVEVKELSQAYITNGKAVQFDFTKNATCVVSVGFDAKKTVGKTTTIAEQLKHKSTLTSNLTEGEVYKYFNVWVGNSGFASPSNIGNPTISFKVAKSWIQDNNIDKNSITLNRYSNKIWEQLPVSLSGEDSTYLYYTANVSGYSFFAITGKANTSTVTEINPGNKPDNSESNTGNTGSEAGNESSESKNKSTPGFEMFCGMVSLSAAFLYKRK